jgi:hypothetical protein
LVTTLFLGAFIGLANGGAILVTVSGGRSHLGDQLADAAWWAAAGVALLVTSIVGMRRKAPEPLLGVHTAILVGLCAALAATGIAVIAGRLIPNQAFVWVPGVLSTLSGYAYLNFLSATRNRDLGPFRWLGIALVICCVVLDVVTFMRLR